MNYKVGQRVKIIDNSNDSINKVGDIGVIIEDMTKFYQTVEKGYYLYRVHVPHRSNNCNLTRSYDMTPIGVNSKIKVL